MGWVLYDAVRFLAWIILRLGFGLEVSGRHHVPARGAFLLAANHVSYLDPLVVGVACPRRVHFMARDSLFVQPIIGTYLRLIRVIPLRRGEGDLEAIREAIDRLRRGQPVAVFPEGTRQVTGRLGQVRRGIGVIARHAAAPVIPVLVKGTFDAFPPGAQRLRRAKIRVAFGPQIAYTKVSFVEGAPREGARQLTDAIAGEWRRLAEQLRA